MPFALLLFALQRYNKKMTLAIPQDKKMKNKYIPFICPFLGDFRHSLIQTNESIIFIL
jgi:hypothetical protein